MAKRITYKQYKQMVEEQGQAILDTLALAATGNLDVTVEIPEGIDVMTDLAIGFSYLIDDIKELLHQQRQYQEELEQRVAERTADLEKALAELRQVQSRYLQEEWSAYTTNRQETDTSLDPLWAPVLNQAIQRRQPIHETVAEQGALLALPIQYADEVIGALGFGAEEAEAWEEEEITAVEAVVEQLGLALENQRLFDQAQQRAAELAVLNEMVGELTQTLDTDLILEAIYRYTSRLMDTTNFYIALHNPENNLVSFPIAVEKDQRVPWRPRPFGNGMTEYILTTGQNLLIEEGVDAWLKTQGVDSIGSLAQSWVGVPLRLGNQVVGVIALQSKQAYYYSRAQLDLLGAVANQAAIAMQNARQFQQEQARARREQLLREIAAKVRSSADVDTIMRTAVQEIGSALGRQTYIHLGQPGNNPQKEDA